MNNTNRIKRNFPFFYHGQSGVVALLVTFLLPIMLCFLAIGVDLGFLMMARNELQRAADGSALAGAQQFFPNNNPGSITNKTVPNWSNGEAGGSTNAPVNKSGGVTLNTYHVVSGYWNLRNPSLGLQGQGITPGQYDAPALQVTVKRTAGENGGSVKHWFTQIIGLTTTDVSATATAVCAFTGTALPGTLLPFAIPQNEIANDLKYNSVSNQMNLTTGAPPASGDGTYTTFYAGTSSDNVIKGLVDTGNPVPVQINSQIWIVSGTKGQSVYNEISGDYTFPHTFLIVVVDQLHNGGDATVEGFVSFTVTAIGGHGVNSYLTGYFSTSEYTGGIVGPYAFNTFSPPMLVK